MLVIRRGGIDLERDSAGRLVAATADGMRATWRYEDGDLVQYEMRAGGKLRTAQLMRDPIGRVVEATIDGARHQFAYDPAGQLASAQTPDGTYAFDYDANGRLAHESSPWRVADYEYDAVGQLAACAVADGAVTRFEYDDAGRRIRESGADLDRTYHWDEGGRLTQVVTARKEQEPRSTGVVVDALGDLAELDGTPMLWDTAHPLQPLAWDGHHSVVGEGSPWALASGESAKWLAPDWRGTVGDAPRDPWGAELAQGAGAAGAHLGFRGEIEFDNDTWLRHRVYQPANRTFLQRDPLPSLPGSAVAANPYHYAANNAIGLADPLGLHPISEKELNSIRDRIDDRGLLEKGRDLAKDIGDGALNVVKVTGKWLYENADDIALGLSVAALLVTPGGAAAIALGVGALAFSGAGAYRSFDRGDVAGGLLNLAGAIPGVRALRGTVKARSALKSAGRLADKADELADMARTAENSGINNMDEFIRKQRRLEGLARNDSRAEEVISRRLLREADRLDKYGLGLGAAGSVRSHLHDDFGIDVPLIPVPEPSH